MSQKPDFYEVLGVARTATSDEIKKAYNKIVMTCHPDRVKLKQGLTEEQKKELAEKFKFSTEAQAVLLDKVKREVYDKYGHRGIENLAAGKSASSGQSYADVAGPVQRRSTNPDDAFDFFTKAAERRKREEGGASAAPSGSAAAEREKARQERLARRNKTAGGASPAPEAKDDNSVADLQERVQEATKHISDPAVMAQVPLATLEKFRESLQELLEHVDRAIGKGQGPRRSGMQP